MPNKCSKNILLKSNTVSPYNNRIVCFLTTLSMSWSEWMKTSSSVSFIIFNVTNAYTYVWCVNTYISTLRKQRHLTSKHQNSCKNSNVEQTNSAITWIKETLFLLHQHESKNRSHLRYDDPKTLSFQNSIILYFPL